MIRSLARARRLAQGLAAYGRRLPERAYVEARASYMLDEYRKRRDRYAAEALRLGVSYDRALVRQRTAERLRLAGLTVRPRGTDDEVHSLVFFPGVGWHAQLLPPLRSFGPVSYFDYNEHGVRSADLYARKPGTEEGRRLYCEAFERFAAEAARKRPVDWVFVYATGVEIRPSTLERVRAITGAPIVGMCLDDKQSWDDAAFDGEPAGQVAYARHLDLAWTSARVACEWYLVEGGNPIFLGEGCSPELYAPAAEVRDPVDVCFIGARYGFRPSFVARLQAAGIDVTTAGHGWARGSLSDEETVALMQRAKVILGLGGVGWSADLKNVKGRDFDAPLVGAYVTSFNPDLTGMFRVGEEIACYSTPDEAVEIVRDLLSSPRHRRRLAEGGRARSLAEHTWRHRFETVLETLGVRR